MSKISKKTEEITQGKRVRIRKIPKGADKEDFDQAQDLTVETKAESKVAKEKLLPIPDIQVKPAATTKQKRKQTIKQEKEADPPDISQTSEYQEYLSTYLRNEEQTIKNLVLAKPAVVQYLNYHHKLAEIKTLSELNNAAQDTATKIDLQAKMTWFKHLQHQEHEKYIDMYKNWQQATSEDSKILEEFEKAESAFNEKSTSAFPQETIPKTDLTELQRDSLLWLLNTIQEAVTLATKEEAQCYEDNNLTEEQAHAMKTLDNNDEFQQVSDQRWEFTYAQDKLQLFKSSWDMRDKYQAIQEELLPKETPPSTPGRAREKQKSTANQDNDDINQIIEGMVTNYDLYANGKGVGLLTQLHKLKDKKEFQGDKKATKILKDAINNERWRLQEDENYEFTSDTESNSSSSSVSATTTNTNDLHIIYKTQHTTCICLIIYYQIVFNITNIEQYSIYIHGIKPMHNYKLSNCLNPSVISLS